MRECIIGALCVSDNVVIIGRGIPKEKRIELKTELCLCSINTSSHSTLFPAHYALVSMVNDGARDNDIIPVSLLRICMVLDRYTLCIEEYIQNRL